MKKAVVARVAVEKTAYSFDMLFDYSVPSALSEEVLPGKRVLVPFGNSSQKRAGMVFAVYPENSTGKNQRARQRAYADKRNALNGKLYQGKYLLHLF